MNVVLLFCLIAIPAVLVLGTSPALRERVAGWVSQSQGWLLALAWLLVAGMAVILIEDDFLPAVMVATIFVVGLAIWLHAFALLMRQPDDAFPGRYDKPIWALLLIILPPVGVLAFWSYRRAHGLPALGKPMAAGAVREWS